MLRSIHVIFFVIQVLYLIGCALQEEESGYYPSLKFCEAAQKRNLMAKLDLLTRCNRVSISTSFDMMMTTPLQLIPSYIWNPRLKAKLYIGYYIRIMIYQNFNLTADSSCCPRLSHSTTL